MICLIAAISIFTKFTNDPGLMFPEHSQSAAIYSAVRDAGIYSSFSVEVDTGQSDGVAAAKSEIGEFAKRVAAVPGVTDVKYSASGEMLQLFSELPSAFVQLFPPEILDRVDAERAASAALTALTMGAPAAQLRRDPGNFKGGFVSAFQAWKKFAPYRFSLSDGIMCDDTRRYAVLRVETDPETVVGAEKIAKVSEHIRQAPPGMGVKAVSPLIHALENEMLARGDIFRIGAISAAALALIFIFLYRCDWRALWILAMPIVSTFAATAVCLVLFDKFSLMVLGIGGGISGFAVDQGIHVYSAVRGSGMLKTGGRLTRALLVALATSVAAFISIAASGVPIFVQLGVFASAILVFNFLLSRFMLPRLLGPGRICAGFNVPAPGKGFSTAILVLASAISVFAVFSLPRLKSDFSISSLDGVGAETKITEADFAKRWKNPQSGDSIIVVKDTEDELLASIAGCERWTPAALVPTSERRAANLEAWRTPAAAEKISKLKRELSASCSARGLPEDFFRPFFDALTEGAASSVQASKPPAIAAVLSATIQKSNGKYSALLFAPEGEKKELLDRVDGALEITPEAVEAAAAASFLPGFLRAALLCAVLQIVLVAFVYRKPKKFAVVFFPVVFAALSGIAFASAAGFKIDVTACIAAVLALGLAVDYGVFALYRVESDTTGDSARAMTLSALTTLAGSMAMMAAGHPTVSKLGAILFFGILLTALAALFLVPAVLRCGLRFPIAALALFSGCVSNEMPVKERLVSRQPPDETRFWNVSANALWYSFPMIVAVRVNPERRFIHAVGMNPSGVTLFESEGSDGVEHRLFLSPVLPEFGAKKLFGQIQTDFARVFFASGELKNTGSVSKGLWPFWGWTLEWDGPSKDGKTFKSAAYSNRATLCGFVFKEMDDDAQ